MTSIDRAYLSLEGLALGDAFGQRFFGEDDSMVALIERRIVPDAPWMLTDDSIMAIGVVDVLGKFGHIDQDALAKVFAENYRRNPRRQYGGMASSLLAEICRGGDWRKLAPAVFDGMGSFGNGAAMRVAPLGAFYAEDDAVLVSESLKSAEVTHNHPEGQAGAVAIAAAAAWTWRNRAATRPGADGLYEYVLALTPESETRSKIARAQRLSAGIRVEHAADMLGRGHGVSSQDTVPLVLWICAQPTTDFKSTMWQTVAALGDRDTTCAMVGGIIALRREMADLPADWLRRRESIYDWEPDPCLL